MSNHDEALPEGFSTGSLSITGYKNIAPKKDGTISIRLLPNLPGQTKVAQYWATHFIRGVDPVNPAKPKFFPVLGIEQRDFRSGLVTKRDPLLEKRRAVEQQIKIIEAKGAEQKASPDAIAKATLPHKQWLRDHGYSGRYRIYVLDAGDNMSPAVLRLSTRTWNSLKALVKEFEEKGLPVRGRKGLIFNITRVGTGFTTPDKVEPVSDVDPSTGNIAFRFHTVSNEKLLEAARVLPKFEDIMAKISYPEEILERLAKTDDPAEVTKILGADAATAHQESEDQLPDWANVEADASAALSAPLVTSAATSASAVSFAATPAAAPAAVPLVAPAVAPAAAVPMSDSDFEKLFR